jgi:hypothetical protein
MRTMEFAESAISGVVADEPHSFKVWGYYAPEVRAMLKTDGVPFTDRRHWLLWRRFEVKASPSVVLQVRRDLHELLDDEPL